MKTTLSASLLLFGGLFSLMADFDIRKADEFKKCVSTKEKLVKLATGMGFTEGPVWVRKEAGFLVFSDIPANELKAWMPPGRLVTYRKPSGNANGNTVDLGHNLITCEHSGRRISIEKGRLVSTFVDKFEGKKFNSPNDAVMTSNGRLYFTDPDYGLGQGKREIEGNYVYCYDLRTATVTAVVKDFDKPNGLCLSPDEKKLYVADSGKPHHIRIFDIQKDASLTNGAVFCEIGNGVPDGIRCDSKGRIWSSAEDGVHIFSPDGSLIGKILVPETPANLCFGGKKNKTLFITARTSLYAIPVEVAGAR